MHASSVRHSLRSQTIDTDKDVIFRCGTSSNKYSVKLFPILYDSNTNLFYIHKCLLLKHRHLGLRRNFQNIFVLHGFLYIVERIIQPATSPLLPRPRFPTCSCLYCKAAKLSFHTGQELKRVQLSQAQDDVFCKHISIRATLGSGL